MWGPQVIPFTTVSGIGTTVFLEKAVPNVYSFTAAIDACAKGASCLGNNPTLEGV